MDNSEKTLSRRKALGRIGLFATAAYTIPAFTTLSMAHASSGSSAASGEASSTSGPSVSGSSGPSVSDASGPSISVPSDVEATCNPDGDLDPTDPDYLVCLAANGVQLG